MSEDSKEAMSSANTSKEEEVQDISMEQEDDKETQEAERSTEEKSEDEKAEDGDTKDDEGDEDDKEEEEAGEEKKDDDEEEDEEEESDDEPQVGLLEKPLVLEEGKKRERKKVERMSFQTTPATSSVLEIKEGKGRSLGDIPFIEFKVSRTKAEDLKPLHRVLFRRTGQNTEVKKNIRQFSGFPFSTSDKEYEKRVEMLKSKTFTIAMVKQIMTILDIPRSGTKDELVTRLLEWLQKPEDSGRKLPEPKRKRKSKGESGKKSKGKKDSKKKPKKKKEAKKKAASDDEGEEEEEEEEEGGDEEEEEEREEEEDKESEEESAESEEEEEPPKKKAKKATPKPKEKKPKQKKTPAKPAKAVPKKKAAPKKKASNEVSDVSSDSDDEPLAVKDNSKAAPTNDELKDVIKKMLDNANLEQVTMKTVLKDVFAKYPNFDLTDRKDFIKNTVKQIIS